MNIYLMTGNAVGTADAMDLADRLTRWHDRMVAHERRGAPCAEGCPHAEARQLWDEAARVFRARAAELRFLHSRGHDQARPARSAIGGRP